MALATAEDVVKRWPGKGSLTAAEETVAETLIGDVEGMVYVAVPDLDALVVAGNPTAAVVTGVVARTVVRAMRNPGGAESRTRSIDDYTTTERYASDARGELRIVDEDLALLSPESSAAAFTITPYGHTHRAYMDDWRATL